MEPVPADQYLVLGLSGQAECGLEHKSKIKEMVGGMESGLVRLRMKDTLIAQLSAISRN